MKNLIVRFIFCFLPAFVMGMLLAILDKGLGLIFFIAIFGLGWQVTSAKPERGEG